MRAFTHDGAAGSVDLSYVVPVLGANAGNLLFTNDAITRVGDCGDRCVYQIVVGARLVVGLKLQFVDEESRRAFVDRYGASLPDILARDDLGWVSVALAQHAKIVVVAAQIGGDPQRLQAILDDSRCSIGDLPACNETVTDVVRYGRELQRDLGDGPPSGDDRGGWVLVLAIMQPSRMLG